MTHNQLVSVRDTIKKLSEEHKEELSPQDKKHCDDTVDFLSNIILDVEKERKFARHSYMIYDLRIEFM